MIRLLRAALAAAILVVTPAFAHDGAVHHGPLNISGPFTRATLPNAPVAGGFLTIENTGAEADLLISATSDVAGETQIHEMAMEGDVMKMRQLVDGLEIPAGETVVLAPGGFHIMFMGLKQPLVEGESVTVTLTFEKAGSVDVVLPVEAAAADAPHAMHHGQAAGHGAAAHASTAAIDQAGLSDIDAITAMQKAMFDTAENPLEMGPIAISGDYAVSDWAQGGTAGRALLRKAAAGWAIHLCAGAGLKDAAELVKIGVPDADAAALAAALAEAEAALPAEQVAAYDAFDGTMMVDEDLI